MISHKFNYNDLKRFKEIGYYSSLGMSWCTILTPWQADLVIFPLEMALLFLSFSLDAAKTRDVTNIGHYGTGNLEIRFTDVKQFEEVQKFIRISYELN